MPVGKHSCPKLPAHQKAHIFVHIINQTMYKYLLPTLALLALTISVSAADLSKEEKKQIKAELKAFKKDPARFKSMIDKYKETIDSNEATLGRDKEAMGKLTNTYADAQKKLASVEADLKFCMDKPEPKCPDVTADVLTIPSSGTIYKVQLGLYKKFDMNSYFYKPKYVGVEKADGLNRYIVSYFEDKIEAEHFAADLRKLGLHDAFVSKYADGKRIYEKGPGKHKKTTLQVQ